MKTLLVNSLSKLSNLSFVFLSDTYKKMSRGGSSVHLSKDDVSNDIINNYVIMTPFLFSSRSFSRSRWTLELSLTVLHSILPCSLTSHKLQFT